MSEKLSDHAYNRYSQFGEDGIIEQIFKQIPPRTRLCVEFGAWDGFHLSNTAHLWTNSWRAVLIEGDPYRFGSLVRRTRGYDTVCVNAFVSRDGPNSLEAILSRYGVNETIDLLSIDIDGDDYHIVASLTTLRPRVLICEHNPTIPGESDLFGNYGDHFGCSAGALVRVAGEKGYRLVAMTETNCFFVLNEEFPAFVQYETRLEKLKIDKHLVYLLVSNTGDYVLSRPCSYPLSFPYRGGLNGAHHRVRFKPVFLRPFLSIVSRVRSFLRRAYERHLK